MEAKLYGQGMGSTEQAVVPKSAYMGTQMRGTNEIVDSAGFLDVSSMLKHLTKQHNTMQHHYGAPVVDAAGFTDTIHMQGHKHKVHDLHQTHMGAHPVDSTGYLETSRMQVGKVGYSDQRQTAPS